MNEVMISVSCRHLSNIDAQILLIVRPVAHRQTQLLLLTGLVQLHLLQEEEDEEEEEE